MLRTTSLFLFFTVFITSVAEARIYIPVNQPSDQRFPIAICDLEGGGFGSDIADIIRNDLTLSGYFNVIPSSIFAKPSQEEGTTIESIRFSYWKMLGAQAIVKGSVQRDGGNFIATIRLFDPFSPEMLAGKQYRTDAKHIREIAHRFSDEIMEILTGVRGVFNTKIAYTAITKKKYKNIFVMDMDGHNARGITSEKSISISPSWSPDGSKIVFSSYMNGNPDLFVTSASGGRGRQITSGEGAKLTPTWSPNGSWIAYASTESGEADLYLVSADGKRRRRLTSGLGIDIAPTFSPDGGEIIFSSERAGNLHVFKTGANGGGSERLTYVGYQNDMPSWSPMADKIVFAGRDMGTFDIFIMNPDGSNIQRLTAGTGSNEHPTFSPDGRFVVFQSTREGGESIYIMRADGGNQMRISKGNGMLPEWGPRVE